jgi:hypothetical protein
VVAHAGSSPLPPCTGLDWNPITASGSEAAVAAVLAGFVFSGIVVILSTTTKRHFQAGQALKLLFVAFLGLGVTSYLLASDSGEQTCSRADTLVVIVGGPLGSFSALMLVALTWLVTAYGAEYEDVLRLLRRLIYVTFGLVMLLLCTSSQYYVSTELGKRDPGGARAASFLIYGSGIALIALGLAALTRRRWASAVIWLAWAEIRNADLSTLREHWRKQVDRCFAGALIYLAVAGSSAGAVSGFPRHWYTPITPTFVYLAGLATFFVPIPLFVLAMRALADTQAMLLAEAGNEKSGPSP